MRQTIALPDAAYTQAWALQSFRSGASDGATKTRRQKSPELARLPMLDWPSDLFAGDATAVDDAGQLPADIGALSELYHSHRGADRTSH